MRSNVARPLLTRWLLPMALGVLMLADGVLHLRLNYLLNGGTLWGSIKRGARLPGPPAGAPLAGAHIPAGHSPSNPFPLPLNEMFTLNFIAAVVLVVAFVVALRWLPRWAALLDLAFVLFSIVSIYGWWQVGKPNPQNLGHYSKALEIVIIVLALGHAALLLAWRNRRAAAAGHSWRESLSV